MKSALLLILFTFFSIDVFGADVEVLVMVGDSVTLHTDTIIWREDVIEWYFGQESIAVIDDGSIRITASVEIVKDRLQLDKQTGDLKIRNIKTTDSGDYKFEITTTTGSSEKTFSVRVSADAVTSVPVMEGDSVTLLTGLTEIQTDDFSIQWMFRDILIAKISKKQEQFTSDGRFTDRLELNNQTGSVTITNTKTTHSGDYELKIISSRYSINRRITVTVTDGPKSVSVKEGDSVTLHTDTEIQNDDLIQWMFGDIRLAVIDKALQRHPIYSDRTFRDRLKLDHQTGSLNITNTRTTDSGLYELRISSSNRRIINRRFTVTVIAASGSGLATGIAIGVGVVVVGVLLVAVYCWWSKRGKPARTVKYNAGTTLNGTQDSNGPAN